ncbi:hypothetical protein [Sphingobacterium siyangense]|uniref:hypothetical protein n=1 Tax=Sphingobacterium siyangense TaxID=459529 RepID=UPI003DA42DB9
MKKIILVNILVLLSLLVLGQSGKLSVGGNGWVLQDSGNGNPAKKFIFGIWGIPQYIAIHNKGQVSGADLLRSKTSFAKYGDKFDLIFTHSEYIKDYMSDHIIMTGSSEFAYMFKDYLKKTDGSYTDGKPLNMKKLASAYSNGSLDNIVYNGFDYLKGQFSAKSNWTYIWAPIDEVVTWPPNLIKGLYQIAKKKGDNLIYCDLFGSGKVNSYMTLSNTIANNRGVDDEKYITSWTNNVVKVAREYQGSGDIYGVNAYGEFYMDPVLAGKAVDGIKSALGNNVPVWLWFDPVGYAKPRTMILSDYITNVKCQIYTSIIHGATGVLLYNDLRKSPTDFDIFYPILKELKQNIDLFYLPTIASNLDGHLHFCIKRNSKTNEQFVIATNTNHTQNLTFSYKKNSKVLKPFEVYISKL